MSKLYRIVYCSRNSAHHGMTSTEEGIAKILLVSRRNNASQGITGALMFNDGCFAQVLEGPANAVELALERIQCDERHHDVTVLQAGPITTRAFGTWSMGFAGGTTGNQTPDGFQLGQAFGSTGEAGDMVLAMLRNVVTQETTWWGRKTEAALAG